MALWVTGQNLSVPSSVGLIALFGIALGNSMVMVTYFNQLVREGVDLDEASIEGACLRVRPVLMTALTTALGLLPLLFSSGTGSEVQRPLATVVVGGLVSSTVADPAGAARPLQVVRRGAGAGRSPGVTPGPEAPGGLFPGGP